jgi:AcrR family transcriptional regulator
VPTSRLDRRTRRARAERRDGREALLRAAVEVLSERGFRDASVDEIAARAGYSKGAFYWHFPSKDDLFFALVDERIDRRWRETIALLESAGPERDMAPEASRRFGELLREQRELLLIDHEYWSLAVRDEELRARYAERQASLRRALARAIAARLEHLGAPRVDRAGAEAMATAFIGLTRGLAAENLIDPEAVPARVLSETLALVYAGHVARAAGSRQRGI